MSNLVHSKSITVDLDRPLVRVNIGGVMASSDKKANQYDAVITRSGANVDLTGCSVYGYMILPNAETLKIAGTASGNMASVIIPQSGYAYDGAFTLAIKVSGTDFNATVALFDGTIAQTVTETIVDGELVLYGVDEILALISDMEEAEKAANTAAMNANEKASAADTAASNANTAASSANAKATAADTAASAANTAAAKIEGLTVQATGLDADASPTAAVSEVDGHKHIAFGIPKGDKGDTGTTPALTVGSVTTGSPGTEASATITGTAEKPVLNLIIPRGDSGSGSVSTVDGVQPDGGDVPLGAVRYTAQTLTEAQQEQARGNIGALGGDDVVDNLTSDDGAKPLSAKQGKALKAMIDVIPVADGAGAHNAIYRGASLGTSVSDAQWAAIADGTFAGLYIGDYWTINSVVYRIAAFDYYYNTGDTACTTHHAVIVPDKRLYTHKMNDTDTTTGAYVGSKMYTEGLDAAKATINSAFGSAHILSHRQFLQNTTTSGYASAGSWYDSTAELMNELCLYGCKIYGNLLHGTATPSEKTVDKSQYPLFAYRPDLIVNLQWFWIRDVASETKFGYINGTGEPYPNGASNVGGVRPAFSIC